MRMLRVSVLSQSLTRYNTSRQIRCWQSHSPTDVKIKYCQQEITSHTVFCLGRIVSKGNAQCCAVGEKAIFLFFLQFIADDLAPRFLCHWQYSQLHNSQYHQTKIMYSKNMTRWQQWFLKETNCDKCCDNCVLRKKKAPSEHNFNLALLSPADCSNLTYFH